MDPLLLAITLIPLCLLGLSWFAGTDAPYVATNSPDLDKTLRAAGIRKGKVFYELGSGDGRVVLAAAKLGAKAIGIEQSLIRVLYSRWQAKKLKLQAQFIHGEIFKRRYLDGDVVFIYLLSPAIKRLEAKLFSELKKGSILITQKYHFPNKAPFKKIGNFNLYRT